MILATGQNSKTREALLKIPVPNRTNTKFWKGINHGTLAATVVDRVQAAGLEISKEWWYVNPKRTILWGAVDIIPGKGSAPKMKIGQAANFSLGVRHGNQGEYAVSFAVGARVGVCSNGMFSGDFVFKKKHSEKLDLPDLVDNAVIHYLKECESLERLINGWREQEIDNRDAAYMILQSHREGYVNFRYLEDVEKNWMSPPHEEFQPRTAWSLYNAFTETAKILTPPRQLKLLTGLRKMFDTEYGVGDAYVGPQRVALEDVTGKN